MIPVVRGLKGGGGDDAYWWALSLGACFGGNATMIAAAANVAAAGLTERAGRPIGFVAFLKVGMPVTVVSLAIATRLRRRPLRGADRRPMPDSIVKQTLREIEPLGADDLIGAAARTRRGASLPGTAGGRGGRRVRGDLRRARVHGRALSGLRRRARLVAR